LYNCRRNQWYIKEMLFDAVIYKNIIEIHKWEIRYLEKHTSYFAYLISFAFALKKKMSTFGIDMKRNTFYFCVIPVDEKYG